MAKRLTHAVLALSLGAVCAAGCATAPGVSEETAGIAMVGRPSLGPGARAPRDPAPAVRLERTGGETPHLPYLARQYHRGAVSGAYRVCIDRRGRATEVAALRGIAGADEAIVSALRTWTFRPQPVPYCYREELRFQVQ